MLGRRRNPNLDRLVRRGNAQRLAEVARRSDLVEGTRGELIDMAAASRRDALLGLAELGPEALAEEDVLETAVSALDDPTEEVAIAAVRALGAADSARARDALASAAAEGLARRGHAEARREAVVVVAHDGQRGVAVLVRRLIDRSIELPLAAEDADAVRLALEHATGSADPTPRLIDGLIEQLKRPDSTGSDRAEEILRWFAPHAVEPLIEAIEHPDARRGAAGAIGATRDARVIPSLKRCLKDEDVETRRRAVVALGEIVSPRAVEPLLAATGDDDYQVRAQAVDALDRLGTVGVVVGIETIARRGTPQIEPPPFDEPPALERRTADERVIEHPPEAADSEREAQPEREREPERVRTIARERFRDDRPLWPGLRAVLERTTGPERDTPVGTEPGGNGPAG